jgi:hypothetical protein
VYSAKFLFSFFFLLPFSAKASLSSLSLLSLPLSLCKFVLRVAPQLHIFAVFPAFFRESSAFLTAWCDTALVPPLGLFVCLFFFLSARASAHLITHGIELASSLFFVVVRVVFSPHPLFVVNGRALRCRTELLHHISVIQASKEVAE